MKNVFTGLLLLGLMIYVPTAVVAQTTQTVFGKNRVQYHTNYQEWSLYESNNFITYWYGEGRNIGQAAVQLAEHDCEAIQKTLEYKYNEKIEIIVYTDLTDLKQSNIGVEEAFINQAGQTKVVDNKLFVYFDGNHNHLRRDLRQGIATIYLNAMLTGANLQEVVQNAVLLNLPNWFKDGLTSYLAETWSTDLDDAMRTVILKNQYPNFTAFARAQPRLAGHSLWYYIHELFGEKNVSNLLYLVRINHSIESGFVYVLGAAPERIYDNWWQFFNKRYTTDSLQRQPVGTPLTIKNKRKLPLTQIKLSPDGAHVAYVLNEIGKYKVYVQHIATGTRQLVHKGGYRNQFQATDYQYPLLAWSPTAQELLMLYERRDVIKSKRYELASGKSSTDVLPDQFQRIHSIAMSTPNDVVMSATVRGFSDIYTYQLNNRQSQRITQDTYDDLDPIIVSLRNQRGVIFASNRPDSLLTKVSLDTILPVGTFDLFYYNLETKPETLLRLTATPLADERHPIAIDTTFFGFLSDEVGIANRRTGYLEDTLLYYQKVYFMQDGKKYTLHEDSLFVGDTLQIDTIVRQPVMTTLSKTYQNTNFLQQLTFQHAAPRVQKWLYTTTTDQKTQVYLAALDTTRYATLAPTQYRALQLNRQNRLAAAEKAKTPPLTTATNQPNRPKTAPSTTPPPKKAEYLFQSEFDDAPPPNRPLPPVTPSVVDTVVAPPPGVVVVPATVPPPAVGIVTADTLPAKGLTPKHLFRQSRIIPYRLKFRTDFVTLNMDNSLLFTGLESYAGTRQEGFSYPPLGILLKANFKDLLEDYEIECGVRLPVIFNGAEYFVTFTNRKKRLDKKYGLYYAIETLTDDNALSPPQKTQRATFIGVYELRYPLDLFSSVRASTTFRNDRATPLATEATSLAAPVINQQRLGLKVEYVFDNTLDVSLNIKNGTRYKVFAEVLKRFELNYADNLTFNTRKGFMTILGTDARYYQRLDKRSVLAFRAVGATTFGAEKILYYLGGTENWLLPKFNNDINIPTDSAFAYTGLAANMRGFRNNIRNGNSFVLGNVELRIPLMAYMYRRPIQSAFLRNLQVIGFFDVGTAWHGATPFTKDNPLNTIVVSHPTVSVKVNYFRDPIVASYGMGLRSSLFGYFIRIDYGWGIETKVVQKPMWHLSLGTDF